MGQVWLKCASISLICYKASRVTLGRTSIAHPRWKIINDEKVMRGIPIPEYGNLFTAGAMIRSAIPPDEQGLAQ